MKAAVRWMFEDRNTGRLVFAQWPNPPLWVFLVASVVRRVADERISNGAGFFATVALATWALLELLKGVNPFRRILGAVVLAGLLARLL